MDQEETKARFKRCEKARKAARAEGKDEIQAHEAAKAVWNGWAEEMLAERKALEDAGEWAGEKIWEDHLEPRNDATRAWMDRAKADFSRLRFQIEAFAQQEEPQAGDDDESSDGSTSIVESILVEGEAVDFSGFIFPGAAWFRDARFSGEARFGRAQFSGRAGFERAQFCRTAQFEGAQFSGNAWFAGAQFSGADFQEARFSGEAWFGEVQFSGDAWFQKARFSGAALFQGARFSGDAWFQKARFSGAALFQQARFSGEAWFRDARLSGEAGFQKARFSGEADFQEAQFSGEAGFQEARFSGDAWFEKAQFSGAALFQQAQFSSYVWFQEARFSHEVDFHGARFSENAMFQGARFSGEARFQEARFSGGARFALATFESVVLFNKAEFFREADFTAVWGKRAFSLADAIFEGVPDFIQAHFEEAPRLDNVQVTGRLVVSQKNKDDEGKLSRLQRLQRCYTYYRITRADRDIPARWRALKRLAIQGHDTDRELQFFSGEMRSARFAGDWPLPWPIWKSSAWSGFFRFWFGLAYQEFSDFGRSFLRPFAAWLVVSAIAAFYFLGQTPALIEEREALTAQGHSVAWAYAATSLAALCQKHECHKGGRPAKQYVGALAPSLSSQTDAWREAWRLARHNALVIVDSSGDSAHRMYGCLYGVERYDSSPVAVVPGQVADASAVQKVASGVMIFLFGLALRNMLKMK